MEKQTNKWNSLQVGLVFVFVFFPILFLFFKVGKPEAEKCFLCDQCHQFQYISS